MKAGTLFKHWSEVRQGIFSALDRLSDEQLDFKPNARLWSLRETVCHIAATEAYWLRYEATHQVASWRETIVLSNKYPTIESLKQLLNDEHARSELIFAQEPDAVLEQVVTVSWGAQVTMEWIIWHVIEHEIHHRGEIYLMLGLMGIEAPDV